MNFGIIIPSDCPDEKLVKLAKELVQREETMIGRHRRQGCRRRHRLYEDLSDDRRNRGDRITP